MPQYLTSFCERDQRKEENTKHFLQQRWRGAEKYTQMCFHKSPVASFVCSGGGSSGGGGPALSAGSSFNLCIWRVFLVLRGLGDVRGAVQNGTFFLLEGTHLLHFGEMSKEIVMVGNDACNNPRAFFSATIVSHFKSCESKFSGFFWTLVLNLVGESIKLLLYWSWDKYLSTALYGFITPPPSYVLVIVGSHTDRNVCMYHNI